jgi:hypothetical protein
MRTWSKKVTFNFFVVPGIEPRALYILDKYSWLVVYIIFNQTMLLIHTRHINVIY